jgi:hypothetical protein
MSVYGRRGRSVSIEVTGVGEARAIVAEDPAVKSGIFLHEIHPWTLMQWDKYLRKLRAAWSEFHRDTGGSTRHSQVVTLAEREAPASRFAVGLITKNRFK